MRARILDGMARRAMPSSILASFREYTRDLAFFRSHYGFFLEAMWVFFRSLLASFREYTRDLVFFRSHYGFFLEAMWVLFRSLLVFFRSHAGFF